MDILSMCKKSNARINKHITNATYKYYKNHISKIGDHKEQIKNIKNTDDIMSKVFAEDKH